MPAHSSYAGHARKCGFSRTTRTSRLGKRAGLQPAASAGLRCPQRHLEHLRSIVCRCMLIVWALDDPWADCMCDSSIASCASGVKPAIRRCMLQSSVISVADGSPFCIIPRSDPIGPLEELHPAARVPATSAATRSETDTCFFIVTSGFAESFFLVAAAPHGLNITPWAGRNGSSNPRAGRRRPHEFSCATTAAVAVPGWSTCREL